MLKYSALKKKRERAFRSLPLNQLIDLTAGVRPVNVALSEVKLSCQLHLARVKCRGNPSKVGAVYVATRILKLSMVEKIENFHAQLESLHLRYVDGLED